MLDAMFNTLAGKRICLFGFAFKANTSDTRESPAIFIAKKLLEENATVIVSDPKALPNAKIDLAEVKGEVFYIEDPYQAAAHSHAIAVLTEWELYRHLDYEQIYHSMVKPAFLFDGRNILNHRKLFDLGFNVFPIGKPRLIHF
jgi:UDPglucose 6-dehydrogenase